MTTDIRVKLLAEKAPYLLTLFVAAAGWLVSYTVSRFEKAPLLEYATRLEGPEATGSLAKEFSATVRNISPSGQVACARVLFTARAQVGGERKLTPGELLQISGPRTDNTFQESENHVVFQMNLHAGATVELPLRAAEPVRLTIAQSPCEAEDGKPSNTPLPILMERSLTTWLIRNSLAVLWIGLVCWAVLLCLLVLTARQPMNAASNSGRTPEKDAGTDAPAAHRPPITETEGNSP